MSFSVEESHLKQMHLGYLLACRPIGPSLAHSDGRSLAQTYYSIVSVPVRLSIPSNTLIIRVCHVGFN
jgi:hypothetical protein